MKNAGIVVTGMVFAIIATTIVLISKPWDNRDTGKDEYALRIDSLNSKIVELKTTIDRHNELSGKPQHDHVTYSHHDWSHDPDMYLENIKVTWPDGHQTIGLEKRQEVLRTKFAHAPDARIVEHPMQHATTNKTGISGLITGTFTKPLTTPAGKTIRPTGKTFTVPIYAVGVWENGKMVEEYVYWDDEYHRIQIGAQKTGLNPFKGKERTENAPNENEIAS